MKFFRSCHPYAIVTVVFWSLAFVFTRIASQAFTVFSLGFLRYLFATLALIPVVVTLILVNLLQIDTIISFSVGCILALVLFWKNIPDKAACISQGFNDGIMPCILVSAVVGLGSVISSTPVFAEIRDNVMLLPINGLAKVDPQKCTACGQCVEACPRHVIAML